MKSKTWMLVLGVLFSACLVVGTIVLLPEEKAVAAEIWSDGELVEILSLSQNRVLKVESRYGTNIITVRDGAIAVTEADCPDHHCMNRGYCHGGMQIVCLPNRLVIQFVGQQTIDGVTG